MLHVWVKGKTIVLLAGLMVLGACAVPAGDASGPAPAVSQDTLTKLQAIAAPYQDLQSVWLKPEDGCYWYSHVGPVETTMLPLRTPDGRPICTQRAIEATQAAG